MPQPQDAKENGEILLIALGSNLDGAQGAPADVVRLAMAALSRRFGKNGRQSGLYRTPAFPPGGPDFVNAAFAAHSEEPPGAVLAFLHDVEERAGRERRDRWGARVLDLDLIALGQRVLPDRAGHAAWRDLPPDDQARQTPDELILPHPRLQDRSFVLVPLAEVAPNWRHPVLGQSVAEMLAARPAEERAAVRRIA